MVQFLLRITIMANIPIGKTDDPFYRYKRPVTIVKHLNNKTIITNLDSISKALNTNAAYILYYIQLQKSVPVIKNEIKAIIPQPEIETLINEYIEQYILCDICHYPELIIDGTQTKLYFSCHACGYSKDIPKNKFTKIMYKLH